MLEAVIFDMDGVIIDSEPLWRKAEIEVFRTVGIEMKEELLAQTTGLSIDEAIRHWFGKMQWRGKSVSQVAEEVLDRLTELINEDSKLVDGTIELIELFKSKQLKIALASSSPYRIIDTVINKFGIREKFDAIESAEELEFSKPHPAIYIGTANKLYVQPNKCLAIEDSINGLISAKAAKMKCIVIPGPFHKNDKGLGLADLVIPALKDINEENIRSIYQ